MDTLAALIGPILMNFATCLYNLEVRKTQQGTSVRRISFSCVFACCFLVLCGKKSVTYGSSRAHLEGSRCQNPFALSTTMDYMSPIAMPPLFPYQNK